MERTFAIIKPDAVSKKLAGQILARDLVNDGPDQIYPETLASAAAELYAGTGPKSQVPAARPALVAAAAPAYSAPAAQPAAPAAKPPSSSCA